MNGPSPTEPRPVAQHPEARLALGALVLGALEPAERTVVEAHLATCPACTAELAELAVLPGLLGRLSPAQAAAVTPGPTAPPTDPPDELLQRILARTRADRAQARGRRIAAWTTAVAAAAAGIVWLVAAGPLATTDREPNAVIVVQGQDRASDVRGKVTLSPSPNGTELALALEGVRPGENCQLVAKTADGRTEVAATWQATYQGEATVTGSTSLRLTEIHNLAITTPDGRTLLDLPIPG